MAKFGLSHMFRQLKAIRISMGSYAHAKGFSGSYVWFKRAFRACRCCLRCCLESLRMEESLEKERDRLEQEPGWRVVFGPSWFRERERGERGSGKGVFRVIDPMIHHASPVIHPWVPYQEYRESREDVFQVGVNMFTFLPWHGLKNDGPLGIL